MSDIPTELAPLASAEHFVAISDNIWSQYPEPHYVTRYAIPAILPVLEARDQLNAVISDIDRSIVVAGADRTLTLPGYAPDDQIVLGPDAFDVPESVRVGTTNHDLPNSAFPNYEPQYQRSIYAELLFHNDAGLNQLRYTVARTQAEQGQTVSLGARIYTSQLPDMGYSGTELGWAPLSEAQELEFLEVIQLLGGISIQTEES